VLRLEQGGPAGCSRIGARQIEQVGREQRRPSVSKITGED